MEIGTQIRKYRTEQGFSQEELADRIFVTRQTISNWENGRNYPDVKSLVMLGNVFGVSLDILVKGDLEEMQEQINEEERKQLDRDSGILAVWLIALLLLPIPLAHFFGWYGMAVYLVLAVFGLRHAMKVEKQKKKLDVQSYKEILALMQGKRLDEIEKAQEVAKRPYQKVLLTIGSALLGVAVGALMFFLLG